MVYVYFESTASHNVDPQKGFTPLCPNELPVPEGDLIVDELNRQNNLAKFKTVSKDVHPANAIWLATTERPQFSNVGGENSDIAWNAHCMSGTRGMELLDGLPQMSEYDFFVGKGFEPDLHPYSSCYHDLQKKVSTGLIEWLKVNKVLSVIVGGLATNYCVGETCKDLAEAGFRVILNLGACRGIGYPEVINEYVLKLKDEYHIIVINSASEIKSV